MKKYLFTPGPSPVPPEVLLEMARPIIHHRTPEFSAALDKAEAAHLACASARRAYQEHGAAHDCEAEFHGPLWSVAS